MKKILLGLLLTTIPLGAKAANTMLAHKICTDGGTFAYHVMSISESKDTIHFRLSGYTILDLGLFKGQHPPRVKSEFSIDKSKCKVSADKLLLDCGRNRDIKNILVKQTNIGSNPSDKGRMESVTLEHLLLQIRYVESVHDRSGFELVIRSKVKGGADRHTTHRTLFPGDKTHGCTDKKEVL